jgi:predicted ATPase
MPGRVVSRRFIGREHELALIDAALAAAASGAATTVLIAAGGGMGATRLVDEALERAAAGPRRSAVRPAATRPAALRPAALR